jgi:hypothetical protein
VPSAGIEPATRGLGTGAQLEEAASDLRDLSTTLDKGRNAKGGDRPLEGKVAAETTSLWRDGARDRGNKQAPRPLVLCQHAKGSLVIDPFTVSDKSLQTLNGV